MAASLRSITVALGGQPAPRRTGLKGPAKRGAAVVARAQDKLCKDMVNQKKDVSGLEGTVKVTFLGKGGQEFTLDCPLVRRPVSPSPHSRQTRRKGCSSTVALNRAACP